MSLSWSLVLILGAVVLIQNREKARALLEWIISLVFRRT